MIISNPIIFIPALASELAAAMTPLEAVPGSPSPAQDVLWLLGVVSASVVVLALADRSISALREALRLRMEARQKPGSTPLHPVVVRSFDEVFRLNTTKCPCDSSPRVVFEGATTSNHLKLWLVIQICPRCDRRFQTYYDVTNASDHPPLGSPPVTPAPR